MPTFKRFEEINAWQKARQLVFTVYQVSGKGAFGRDFALRNQVRRAAVSIMANVAEGYGRHSDKEFANFLNIAHASVAETQSHLYVALDLGYLDETAFLNLYKSLDDVSRMTLALARHLHGITR